MPRHPHSLPQRGWNSQTAQGWSYLLYTFSNGPFFSIYLFYAEWTLIKSSNTRALAGQSAASLWFNPTTHAHPPPPHFFPSGILRLIGSTCVSSVGPSLSVSADERMRALQEVAARVLAVLPYELDGFGWGGDVWGGARGVGVYAAAYTTIGCQMRCC